MASRRLDKVNELMRREISTVIQHDFAFPDTIISVLEVDITEDLKEGKVWIGIIGKLSPKQVIEQLNQRRGTIQSAVAKRVTMRNTPRLTFRFDSSARHGVGLVNLLDDIEANLPKAPPEETAPEP